MKINALGAELSKSATPKGLLLAESGHLKAPDNKTIGCLRIGSIVRRSITLDQGIKNLLVLTVS